MAELYCYRDACRPCSADCMAYCAELPKQYTEADQWAHCRLLLDSERTARHLIILANNKTAQTAATTRLLNQVAPGVKL